MRRTMSSSKLAHDIVADIIDGLTSYVCIADAWWVMDDEARNDLTKTLEDTVDNQLQIAAESQLRSAKG